jgi:hypothetical protein
VLARLGRKIDRDLFYVMSETVPASSEKTKHEPIARRMWRKYSNAVCGGSLDTLDSSVLRTIHNSYYTVLNAVCEVYKKQSDHAGLVVRVLEAFNDEFNEDYRHLDYYGHEEPKGVHT